MQFQINYTRKITIATTQTYTNQKGTQDLIKGTHDRKERQSQTDLKPKCSVAKKNGGSLALNSLTSDLFSPREVVTSEYVIISDRIGSKG